MLPAPLQDEQEEGTTVTVLLVQQLELELAVNARECPIPGGGEGGVDLILAKFINLVPMQFYLVCKVHAVILVPKLLNNR